MQRLRRLAARVALVAAGVVLAACARPERAPGTAHPPGPAPKWTLPKLEVMTWSSREAGFGPVVRRINYAAEFGDYGLEVDPADGGRIVAFSLDGRSVVLPREESPDAYGSSLWPSPQSDWGWPPPLELDKGPWRTSVEGGSLVLESGVAAELRIAVKQRLTPDRARGALRIDTEWWNHGPSPRKLAPWQNTRVRPGGLTFFPSPERSFPASTLALVPEAGVVWFQHVHRPMKDGVKAFSDGAEGWLAHVDRDLLFVKVFPEVPRSAQPATEAEIELYVDAKGRFVEVEQQGPYVEIAPGAHYAWTVHWLLRRLPAGVGAAPGDARLLELARSVAKSVALNDAR